MTCQLTPWVRGRRGHQKWGLLKVSGIAGGVEEPLGQGGWFSGYLTGGVGLPMLAPPSDLILNEVHRSAVVLEGIPPSNEQKIAAIIRRLCTQGNPVCVGYIRDSR